MLTIANLLPEVRICLNTKLPTLFFCRLLWNDNSGYIGMINVDSTGETKYDIQQTTGRERMAVTMYKVRLQERFHLVFGIEVFVNDT